MGPILICPERGQAEHVGRNGDVGERELGADDPRTRIKDPLKIVKERFDRFS